MRDKCFFWVVIRNACNYELSLITNFTFTIKIFRIMKNCKIWVVTVVFLFAFRGSTLWGQSPTQLLEVLPNTSSLTSDQLDRFNKISALTNYNAYWLVKINAIQNNLTGNQLTVQLPGQTSAVSFTADYVTSTQDGTYYWSGYHPNESNITIGKTSEGFGGNVYLSTTNETFEIVGLSGDKALFLKQSPNYVANSGCGTGPNADEDTDEGIEERSGCEVNYIRVLFLFTPMAGSSGFPQRPEQQAS
jgi:hypothetical protein